MIRLIFSITFAMLLYYGLAAEVKTPRGAQLIVYLNAQKMFKNEMLREMSSSMQETGINPSDVKWMVLSIDKLASLIEEKPVASPSIALACCGKFNANVVEAEIQKAQKAHPSKTKKESGQLLWMQNFEPVVSQAAKDIVVIANSAKALETEKKLFSDEIPAGVFARKIPDCIVCATVLDVDKLVAAVQMKNKMSGGLENPLLSMVKDVKIAGLILDVFKDNHDIVLLKLSLVCKDVPAAQKLANSITAMFASGNEMIQNLKVVRHGKSVTLKGMMNPIGFFAAAMMGTSQNQTGAGGPQ